MAMKFNVGGNNGKKIVTEEELDELDELDDIVEDDSSNNSKKSSDDYEKQKLIKKMGLILLVIVAALFILFFITSLTGGKKTYEEIEAIMVEAAEEYFADHQENLPKKDGGTQTVDVSVLVAEGKMKALSKYTSAACTGTVKVEKTGSTYLYIPKLDCGESYNSQTLYDKIKADNSIVSSGYGLYNKSGNYVFRGESVNNYVKLDNALWRIVKLTSGNEIVLVRSEPINELLPWDNRYNEASGYRSGINNFSSSRVKEALDELYKTTDEDIVEVLLSDKDKGKLVSFNLCTGKRAKTETAAEQAVECKEVSRDQKIGLLTAADYMTASIDSKCTSPSSLNCQNYNWLVTTNTTWWLATSSTTSSYHTYVIDGKRGIRETTTDTYARIRPVIHLNTNVLYKSGSGTAEDPYLTK